MTGARVRWHRSAANRGPLFFSASSRDEPYGKIVEAATSAYEVDWPVAFVELFTFGVLLRPWRDPQPSPAPALGFFTADVFRPDNYRTAYPFGSYARVTEADDAWGARILARIST